MSMVANALAWHSERWFDASAQAIKYVVGATELEINAVKGNTLYESVTTEETKVRGRRDDWIVKVADIASAWPPAPGHQIQDGTYVYEVQNLGDEPCYAPFRGDLLVRIHVRLITTA